MNDNKGTFYGYANIFNYKDFYNDIILPTAFSKSLNKNNIKNIPFLFQHNNSDKIGKFELIEEDETGLYVKGTVNTHNILYEFIKNNKIIGLSIGYIAKNYYFENNNRIITEIDLKEISLVLNPANRLSTIRYCK